MAMITCAISGLRFKTSFCDNLSLSHAEGYPHPIFAAPHSYLMKMYTLQVKGTLSQTDSYLLFLAFMHSTDKVDWRSCVTLDPTSTKTQALVHNNITQLVRVLSKTYVIKHPRFKQPSLVIDHETSDLSPIKGWISAWDENIAEFYSRKAAVSYRSDINRIENRLTTLIEDGRTVESLASMVSKWAAIAGDFPEKDSARYIKIISSCFSSKAMFAIPLAEIKALKEYCACEIDVDATHYKILCETLDGGIKSHIDYLGGSAESAGFSLLPALFDTPQREVMYSGIEGVDKIERVSIEEKKILKKILEDAPDSFPKREDYPTSFKFLQAKLAYRTKKSTDKAAAKAVSKITPINSKEDK